MASGELNVDAIDDISDMVRTMAALRVPSKGLRTLDEMKTRVKEALSLSRDKSNWTAGKAFSVLSQAKEEDAKKRAKLVTLYTATQRCLERMDDRVVTLLNQNIGNVVDKINNHKLQLVQKQYFVLVAGETSAGKSSLLNLILGEQLLPYSVLSTTSTICELKYGEDIRLVAHFKDKDPETGLATKSFTLAHQGTSSEDSYLEQISKFVHVKNDREKGSAFKKIEVFWPHILLRSGIVIVDSPGIGESDIMDEIVTQYLPEAFAFIYVINSTNAGGIQRDRLEKLLEDVRRVSLEGQREFPSKCALFVCNKWDQVPEKEKNEVKNHVIRKLKRCWPNLDPVSQVICMSTTNAGTAQTHGAVTDEFSALMDGIKSMVLKSIEVRLEIYWKWLDYLLSRMVYQTRAFVQNAARDREHVYEKMASIIARLYVIEREQNAVMADLYRHLKAKIDSAVSQLSEHLTSHDVKTWFTTWTLDDVPRAESSWEITQNEIAKVLGSRLRELVERWEEGNHVFADARQSLVQHFMQRYNFVEGQLRNLENSVTADADTITSPESDSLAASIFTTAEKVVIGVTSPIWVPLGLVAFVIGVPVIGIMAIKSKLEDRSKTKQYEKDKCGFMAEASKEYLFDAAGEQVLKYYVKDQLKEAHNCLQQIEARIPELIQADKLLCQQLRDENRSKEEIHDFYIPLMEKSTDLKGELAMFALKEARAVDIRCDELEWNRDDSSRLGMGAFAVVYKGMLKRDGINQAVALKVCREPLKASNASLFLAEEDTLRKLKHRHIVKFYGTALLKERDQITPILVMELCKENLKTHIFEDPKVAPGTSQNPAAQRQVIRWAKEITDALAFIHEQGIVHRDLKLENVLLSDGNVAKITDVGIAKEAKNITGTIAGTPAYIAPEVFNSKVYDSKADIYSLGLVLWEMWYGKQVFGEIQRLSMGAFFSEVDEGYRPSHVKGHKNPPEPWQKLMHICSLKQPEKRPTAESCFKTLTTLYEETVRNL